MKKSLIISLVFLLIVAVFAGCQSNQPDISGSGTESTETTVAEEASATEASAETTPEKREINNTFIEKKSDDLPQLDLTDAIPDPYKENIYGHYYVLRDWSVEKCEDFAKSMRDNGFESYKNVVGGKIEDFYVYSYDEYYCFSPYKGSFSDLSVDETDEETLSSYWSLEWDKTSSNHIGDAPDSQSALAAIKDYAADYFGGAKYLIDSCLVDETSDALYESMGLKFCRVCTKPVEDTYAFFDQYIVGKSKAVPVSDISQKFDDDDRRICDIDADGKTEAVFFDFNVEGDVAYSITVIGVENGDPFEKYNFFVSYDDRIFSVLEQCNEVSVDEESQAIIVKGDSGVYQLKVKDGEIQCSKIE